MPQRKSGIQELKKNEKRRMRNLDMKTAIRKTVKSFKQAVEDKNFDDAKKQLSVVFKKYDKAAKTGLYKENTAARRKAFFTKFLTKAQAEQ